METVVVTATPLPVGSDELGRSIETVSRNRLIRNGSTSIPEALERLTTVSVSERGGGLVQSDLSIRGSTFQQVLVTIDGLPSMDPQTGHHNMDLPLPLGAVERVTVIPGPGSAIFGPAAFGGIVDLTLRKPTETQSRFLSAAGDFDTFRMDAAVDVVEGSVAGTLAPSYATSEGFQEGADYEIWSLWGSAFTEFKRVLVRISAGHTDKDFGAQNFYSAYPSREWTSVSLIDLAPQVELASGWCIKGIARFRRHDDKFILIEDDPSFYQNRHTTKSFIERITVVSPDYVLGATAGGIERSDAMLDSSNLGDREGAVNSVFLQHRTTGEFWTADGGLRTDRDDRWGTEVSPSLCLSVRVCEPLALRVAAAGAIRPPSFTELYYNDPANIGNADLEPEKARGLETGIDLEVQEHAKVSASCFLRDSEKLIDWVRASPEEPWEASNVGKAKFRGGELAVGGNGKPIEWRTSYRYTDVSAETNGLESKYALNVARHDIGLMLGLREAHGFSASVTARHRDVPTLDRYWLLGARLAQRFGDVTVFTLGRNLLDESYEEIPDVPTAGRYVEAGVEVHW